MLLKDVIKVEKFDFIVIGSGPAGRRGAIQAAKLGKKVGLIEQQQAIGGGALHTGTIPSKTLREAVLYLSGWKQRGIYGRAYRVKSDITAQDLMHRLGVTLNNEVEVIGHQLQRNGVRSIVGKASFVNPQKIAVERGVDDVITLEAEKVLIATGTSPARPQGIDFDGEAVVDSDDLMNLKQLPRTLLVVGAGVIGVEYASIFSALDIKVTLVDTRKTLLDFLDREIVDEFLHLLRERGVTIRLGDAVESVKRTDSGGAKVVFSSGRQLKTDMVLFASGRQGNTAQLNLSAAKLKADKRGRLTVDEHYRTEAKNIYAAGDVIGFPSLASTSMEQGRHAACHAFGQRISGRFNEFPFGIYAVPEMSVVGLTEEDAVAKEIPYEVGIARFRETSRGQIMGVNEGVLKLLFNLVNKRLIGVHIIGEGATELVHIGQAVLQLGGTLDYFVHTVFNYPTLAEAYKIAALDAWNRFPD